MIVCVPVAARSKSCITTLVLKKRQTLARTHWARKKLVLLVLPLQKPQCHNRLRLIRQRQYLPRHSTGTGYRASTPTRRGFLLAYTPWQDTGQSPAGQEPPAQEPGPELPGQRPPPRQRQSAPTCLQKDHHANRLRALWQQYPLHSLAQYPYVAASHNRPNKPCQNMHGLGPRKASGQAHASSAHHGPHLKLAARNTQNITPVTLPANGCAGYCTGRNSIVTAPSFASAGMGGGTPLCRNLGLRSGKHRHAGFKPLAYISNIHARLQKQQQ